MGVDSHHELMERLAAVLASISSADTGVEVMNLVNAAYANGYRTARLEGDREEIRDGAGRLLSVLERGTGAFVEAPLTGHPPGTTTAREFDRADEPTVIRTYPGGGAEDALAGTTRISIRCNHPIHYGQIVADVEPGGAGLLIMPAYP